MGGEGVGVHSEIESRQKRDRQMEENSEGEVVGEQAELLVSTSCPQRMTKLTTCVRLTPAYASGPWHDQRGGVLAQERS